MTTPPTTSLEISKKLAEAGYKMDTQFSWVDGELWDKTMQSDYETPSTPPRSEWLPAPLTDELLSVLPHEVDGGKGLRVYKHEHDYELEYYSGGFDTYSKRSTSLPDACALLLLELIARAIIHVEK